VSGGAAAPHEGEAMSSFRYERPESVAQATALLAAAPGRARVLAGGTDLLVALRAGGARPELVVDVKRIPGIGDIAWTDGGDLVLGACALVEEIAADARVRAVFPALAEGAGAIGSLQIRWRATVGGNLANASPCMDTAPPLLVLDALAELAQRVLGEVAGEAVEPVVEGRGARHRDVERAPRPRHARHLPFRQDRAWPRDGRGQPHRRDRRAGVPGAGGLPGHMKKAAIAIRAAATVFERRTEW